MDGSIEAIVKICDARPAPRHISTSYVERQNHTIRMAISQVHAVTNAFSKKLDTEREECELA